MGTLSGEIRMEHIEIIHKSPLHLKFDNLLLRFRRPTEIEFTFNTKR
jgi:hypothetical protein